MQQLLQVFLVAFVAKGCGWGCEFRRIFDAAFRMIEQLFPPSKQQQPQQEKNKKARNQQEREDRKKMNRKEKEHAWQKKNARWTNTEVQTGPSEVCVPPSQPHLVKEYLTIPVGTTSSGRWPDLIDHNPKKNHTRMRQRPHNRIPSAIFCVTYSASVSMITYSASVSMINQYFSG